MDNLFSTHPNTENRIAELEKQARAIGRMDGPGGNRGGALRGVASDDDGGDGYGSGPDDRRGPWGRRRDRDQERGPWG
jgi:heat shock protein HtpX